MNVTSRKETTIGGLMVVRTDSHTFMSKRAFVSWNNATGKLTSCGKYPVKAPEKRPLVSGATFGTRIRVDGAASSALASEIATNNQSALVVRMIVDSANT